MKSNTNHQEIESIRLAKKLLLDLNEEIQKEVHDDDPALIGEIDALLLHDLITKLKHSVNRVIEQFKAKEAEERSLYEPILQRLEANIRNHYKIEAQLKLSNLLLEEKLKSFMIKDKQNKQQHSGALSSIISESEDNPPHEVYNDNKSDQEILIIKAENSNLKAKLSKYETIIQIGDQKEREANEEFKKEKANLVKKISILESKLSSSQKHHKSAFPTSSNNTNINIGNIYVSNLLSKNQNNNKNKLGISKDTKKTNEQSKSSRSPKGGSINKLIDKFKPVKGKSSINSKETSADLDINTCEQVTTSKVNTMKKSNQLNESLSNKNYFLNTYNKMMNKLSPQKTSSYHHPISKHIRITSSLSQQKTTEEGKKTSSNLNTIESGGNCKNTTSHLHSHKKYKITNFMMYKSPKGKESNYKVSSSSREENKTTFSLRK